MEILKRNSLQVDFITISLHSFIFLEYVIFKTLGAYSKISKKVFPRIACICSVTGNTLPRLWTNGKILTNKSAIKMELRFLQRIETLTNLQLKLLTISNQLLCILSKMRWCQAKHKNIWFKVHKWINFWQTKISRSRCSS